MTAADIVADGVVRSVGDGRWDAFLPVSTIQCHAANLMKLPGGDLGCVWFGGTQEGTHDTGVYLSRLRPDTNAWTPPEQMSWDAERSEQNPVLFVAPDRVVWLLYTAQRAGNQDTAEVRCRTSSDDGHTWSRSRTLISADHRGGIFVRQPPVVLDDGRWVLPTFRCVRVHGLRWSGDADVSSVWVSADGGASWVEHEVPDSTGAVHMNVLALPGGRFRALYRSRWADAVYVNDSADGVMWSRPAPTSLPNNNSSIQAVVLPDGALALAYNHSSASDATSRRVSLYDEIGDDGTVVDEIGDRDRIASTPSANLRSAELGESVDDRGAVPGAPRAFWGAPRAPLSIAISWDQGRSWPMRRDVETGDGYCLTNDSRSGRNHELSYPSVRCDPDGALHVAFTYHRRAIKYVRLAPGWVGAQS